MKHFSRDLRRLSATAQTHAGITQARSVTQVDAVIVSRLSLGDLGWELPTLPPGRDTRHGEKQKRHATATELCPEFTLAGSGQRL
jgi:hypothetical protein